MQCALWGKYFAGKLNLFSRSIPLRILNLPSFMARSAMLPDEGLLPELLLGEEVDDNDTRERDEGQAIEDRPD